MRKKCSRQPFDTGGSCDPNSAAGGSSDDPNGACFLSCVVEGYQEWTKATSVPGAINAKKGRQSYVPCFCLFVWLVGWLFGWLVGWWVVGGWLLLCLGGGLMGGTGSS